MKWIAQLKMKKYCSICIFGIAYSKVKKRQTREETDRGKEEGREKNRLQGVKRPCSTHTV